MVLKGGQTRSAQFGATRLRFSCAALFRRFALCLHGHRACSKREGEDGAKYEHAQVCSETWQTRCNRQTVLNRHALHRAVAGGVDRNNNTPTDHPSSSLLHTCCALALLRLLGFNGGPDPLQHCKARHPLIGVCRFSSRRPSATPRSEALHVPPSSSMVSRAAQSTVL